MVLLSRPVVLSLREAVRCMEPAVLCLVSVHKTGAQNCKIVRKTTIEFHSWENDGKRTRTIPESRLFGPKTTSTATGATRPS